LQDVGGGLLRAYLTVFSKTIKRDRAAYFDIIHVPGSDRQDNQGSYYRFPNGGA
jgi:hypothetical protein